jgi:hypothetical protein
VLSWTLLLVMAITYCQIVQYVSPSFGFTATGDASSKQVNSTVDWILLYYPTINETALRELLPTLDQADVLNELFSDRAEPLSAPEFFGRISGLEPLK